MLVMVKVKVMANPRHLPRGFQHHPHDHFNSLFPQVISKELFGLLMQFYFSHPAWPTL